MLPSRLSEFTQSFAELQEPDFHDDAFPLRLLAQYQHIRNCTPSGSIGFDRAGEITWTGALDSPVLWSDCGKRKPTGFECIRRWR